MKAGDGRHFANFNYSLHAFANRSFNHKILENME